MAFMVNLKEVYIDPADVEAYLTEIANLWQGEEDNYENEAVTSQIMDFVYNKDTDDAHFTFDKADNELVMRKGKDFYQLIRAVTSPVKKLKATTNRRGTGSFVGPFFDQ